METSIALARLIGPIYLVVAAGLLLNQEQFRAVANEYSNALTAAGLAALALGSYLTAVGYWLGPLG